MKRFKFLKIIWVSFIGLFIGFSPFKSQERKVYIYNDDGSKELKEFEEIKYADYFEIVEPNGTLVKCEELNSTLFLATSVPFVDKGELSIRVMKSFPNKEITI